jgi:hypothetical protein
MAYLNSLIRAIKFHIIYIRVKNQQNRVYIPYGDRVTAKQSWDGGSHPLTVPPRLPSIGGGRVAVNHDAVKFIQYFCSKVRTSSCDHDLVDPKKKCMKHNRVSIICRKSEYGMLFLYRNQNQGRWRTADSTHQQRGHQRSAASRRVRSDRWSGQRSCTSTSTCALYSSDTLLCCRLSRTEDCGPTERGWRVNCLMPYKMSATQSASATVGQQLTLGCGPQILPWPRRLSLPLFQR